MTEAPASEEAVPAHPASTVLLLRDTPRGFEVHLQQRRAEMSFGPLAYVFPGGSVDAGDRAPETRSLLGGVDLSAAAARMELDGDDADRELCAALYVCAVREVFEEAGVLLARPLDGGDRAHDPSAVGEVRDRVLAMAGFAGELRGLGLRPAVEDLAYVARFITPVGLPRRYDARFFVARVPEGQDIDVHAGEASTGRWFTPGDLLEREDVVLMPPTRVMLAELRRHDDVASVIADLGAREVCGILFAFRHITQPLPDHLPTVAEVEGMEARL